MSAYAHAHEARRRPARHGQADASGAPLSPPPNTPPHAPPVALSLPGDVSSPRESEGRGVGRQRGSLRGRRTGEGTAPPAAAPLGTAPVTWFLRCPICTACQVEIFRPDRAPGALTCRRCDRVAPAESWLVAGYTNRQEPPAAIGAWEDARKGLRATRTA